MFSIAVDTSRKLIHLRMSGLFSPPEVALFWQDVMAAFSKLNAPLAEVDVLVETPGDILQTQDVVAAFGKLRHGVPVLPRIAVVTTGRLLRMQLRRILPPDNARLFDTAVEARHWLNEERRTPRAA